MNYKRTEIKASKINIGDKVYRIESCNDNYIVLDENNEWELIKIEDYFKDHPDFIIVALFYNKNKNKYWEQTGLNRFYKINDFKINCYEQLSLF